MLVALQVVPYMPEAVGFETLKGHFDAVRLIRGEPVHRRRNWWGWEP